MNFLDTKSFIIIFNLTCDFSAVYWSFSVNSSVLVSIVYHQEKIRGQRGKLGALAGIWEFHLTVYLDIV